MPVLVNDGSDNSNIFALQVTVSPLDDPPVIDGQNPVATPEDTAITIRFSHLLVTDPDLPSYPNGFTLTVQDGVNYTRLLNTITPVTNFDGVLSVPVFVNDGSSNSNIEAFAAAVIAYEPVWAIGTGLTASPEQAQDVHRHIRARLAEQDAELADRVQILYGGSMKGENAPGLLAMPDIDGGLIGGASLRAKDFLAIAEAASQG